MTTKEHTIRKSIKECQVVINREMAISKDLRNLKSIEWHQAHMKKLEGMLDAL